MQKLVVNPLEMPNCDHTKAFMESANYLVILALILLPLLFFLRRKNPTKRVPPGSLGLPIIGQSLGLLRAMRANKYEEWLHERIRKYGPISKLHIFGNPTVFLHGPAANKFIYTCDWKTLASKQPASVRRLAGERVILELNGEDHRRMRGAIMSFLKPETLRKSVGWIDVEIRMHLEEHWHGNSTREITVMPLMKTLTFNVICSLIFGIERGTRRDMLLNLFEQLIAGLLAVPINLPFTTFNRSLRASSKIRDVIMELIREKREKLEEQDNLDDHQDLISSLLSMRDEANSPLLSDEEIVDNSIITMIGGHDTTSILLTFLIKVLAEYPHVYETVLNEQEEIARAKASEELLTWDDLARMKYTWRVATETLRMYSPVTFTFREAVKDIELGGYTIPKGWKVTWAPCMTHMDKSIFPDPSKFDPSRFENQKAIPPYSFVAFGGGSRMCPGYEFARVETLTMIHHLVTGFQWKLRMKENFFSRNPCPVFKQGLPIHIEIKKPHNDAM